MEHKLIGESPAFLETLEQVSRVAPLNKPVLVIGERGTGKEMTAERLHFLSSQWDKTLIKLNCSALPETLLESEMFGYEAGAFTGASKRHYGRFERAHGGTLFLDEIASMSLRLQEKLLRVVEYGEFERVGGDTTLKVDVRVVGAANANLPALVEQGRFRADLLDRLSFDVITLPPLRYRQEDILPLAEYFAMGMVKELRRTYFPGFSNQVSEDLLRYTWPGNIRELKNVVERAVYQSSAEVPVDTVIFDPFASPYRPLSTDNKTDTGELVEQAAQSERSVVAPDQTELPSDFKGHVQEYEKVILNRALKTHRYNQKETARALGLSYDQLRGYLRKYPLLE